MHLNRIEYGLNRFFILVRGHKIGFWNLTLSSFLEGGEFDTFGERWVGFEQVPSISCFVLGGFSEPNHDRMQPRRHLKGQS